MQRRGSLTTLKDKAYLLKVNQVPVQEFLKLRFNFDKKKQDEKVNREKKNLSQRRYKELTSQYTCNNRDPRLVIIQETNLIDVNEGAKSKIGSLVNRTQTKGNLSVTNRTWKNSDDQKQQEFKTEFSKYIFQGQNYEPKKRNNKAKQNIKFADDQQSIATQDVNDKRTDLLSRETTTTKIQNFGKTKNSLTSIGELNTDLKSPLPKIEKSLFSPTGSNRANSGNNNNMNQSGLNFTKQLNNSMNHKGCLSPGIYSRPEKYNIFQRNTVANEFLQTGMGKQFNQLLFYNSLKYSQHSPRGKELRLLSAQPNLTKANLNHFSARKQSNFNKTPMTDLMGMYQNDSFTSKQQLMEDKFFKSVLNPSEAGAISFPKPHTKNDSPLKNEKGEFQCFKEIDYENWFSSKIRKMKDANQLKNHCLDEKHKNYTQMKSFCNSKSKFHVFSQGNSPLRQSLENMVII